MVRVFIDLASNIALVLVKDNRIAYYEDFDYTVNVLDVLYSKLQDLKVEEAIVVLHGVIADKTELWDWEQKGLKVRESRADFDAFRHLFGALMIPKVFFYEFAGYYMTQATGRVLFVDQDDSQYQLLVYTDGFTQSQIVTSGNLQQSVRTLCNKYSLNHIVDVKNLVVPQFLEYFQNVQDVPEDVYPRISLFAFTVTSASESCIVREVKPPQQSAEPLQLAEQMPSQQSTKQMTQFEKSEKKKGLFSFGKKKKGIPTLLALFVSVLCLGSTATVYVGCTMYNKVLATDVENVNTLNSQYLSESEELIAYRRVKNQAEGVSAEETPIGILASLEYDNGFDFTIESERDFVRMQGKFPSKREATKFVSKVKKIFNVTDSSIVKGKKAKYSVDVFIQIV